MAKREKIWIVRSLDWTSTEDIFEKGEQPGTEVAVMRDTDVGTWPTFEEMKAGLIQRGLPEDKDAWAVFSDQDGRIDVQFLVNVDNIIADEAEIRKWKAGELQLWAAYVIIFVEVGEVESPDYKKLKKLTGLQTI